MAKRADYDRGRVLTVQLQRAFVFNGNRIDTAIVEVDHINFGLNKKTGRLNSKRRTTFKVSDVEKFLLLLHDEFIAARSYKGKVSRFEVRIDCPIAGAFYGREFIMIFNTHYDKPSQIYTITLFPGW